MGLRILYAFAAFVGAAWAAGGLADGRQQDVLAGAAVLAVAGALLWRSLRNPEVARKGGYFAQVTLRHDPRRPGTPAEIKAHQGHWQVTLDRTPERDDLGMQATPQRGWVWLDAAGLPERVRIDRGSRWQSWRVIDGSAVAVAAGGSE